MKCPKCKLGDSAVINSRPQDAAVYRRRLCLKCSHRWTTRELATDVIPRPLVNAARDLQTAVFTAFHKFTAQLPKRT